MIIISSLVVLIYIFLIVYMIIGFNRISEVKLEKINTTNSFSIVIPFRDEENTLPELIKSITRIDYPKEFFEVIFINDESTDNSVNTINDLFKNNSINHTVINNERFSKSPKKDAITLGVKKAKFDWIVTTDADCTLPKLWLQCWSKLIDRKSPNLICGPVAYKNIKSWLDYFQNFELLSLMSFTIGSFGNNKPFMCNGANLCYNKSFFNFMNGYNNNNNIASGDDVFLLENALKFDASKVYFIKSKTAIVLTQTEKTIKNVIQQRIRWASKTSSYKNYRGKLIGLLILLMNALLISLTILSFTGLRYFEILVFSLIIKLLFDGMLIIQSNSFFQKSKFSLIHYLSSSLLYPVFSVYIAIMSVFCEYKWKGRRFAK